MGEFLVLAFKGEKMTRVIVVSERDSLPLLLISTKMSVEPQLACLSESGVAL